MSSKRTNASGELSKEDFVTVFFCNLCNFTL